MPAGLPPTRATLLPMILPPTRDTLLPMILPPTRDTLRLLPAALPPSRATLPTSRATLRLLPAALLLILLLMVLPLPAGAYFGLTSKESLSHYTSPTPVTSSTHSRPHLKQCDLLPLTRRQRRQCRKEPGLAEALKEAVRLGIVECQFQLRSERWNCSLQGRGSLLKRGFKETAFLYAVSAAALTHSLAKACSGGRMERCTCDDSPGLESQRAWQWGVCGDNLRHSIRFLQNFLGQKKGGRDTRARVDLHNTNAGIKAVKSGLKTTCKCHGVSGSCAVRTCWKQLSPFHETGALLKAKYENAVKVLGATNEAVGGHESLGQMFAGRALRSTDLVYLEDSPSFCRASRFSPGTAGRMCSRETTCDSLCCGRGYNTQSRMVTFSCHCQVHWCCHVECQKCVQQQDTYTCKQ